MSGQDDGAALGVDALNEVPQIAASLRIEAGGRLVEEHDLRVVDQRGGDGEPLLLASG